MIWPSMTGQQTPDGAPRHAGLWRNYHTDGVINHAAWLRARAEKQFVGTCRACGDYLTPQAPAEIAGRTDYIAACRSDMCGWECVAPGGRLHTGRPARSTKDRSRS